jgi:cell division protein FtsB
MVPVLPGRTAGSVTPRKFITIFVATVLAYLLVSNAWINLMQPALRLWQEKQQLQVAITQLERAQQELLALVEYQKTATYIVEAARHWLLMAWPGERVIVPVPQAERPPEQKAPSEEKNQTQPLSLWQQFQNWLFGGP